MSKKPYPVGSPEAKAVVAKIRQQEFERRNLVVRPDGTFARPRSRKEKS